MNLTTYSDIYLSIAAAVQSVAPTRLMLAKGYPQPPLTGVEEWVSYALVSIQEMPSEGHAVLQDISIQVTSFSVHAHLRSDRKIGRVFEMADQYAKAFRRKSVRANNSCIMFKEPRIIPLDLASAGDFSKIAYQQSPSLDTMSTVMLIDALVGSHTLPE